MKSRHYHLYPLLLLLAFVMAACSSGEEATETTGSTTTESTTESTSVGAESATTRDLPLDPVPTESVEHYAETEGSVSLGIASSDASARRSVAEAPAVSSSHGVRGGRSSEEGEAVTIVDGSAPGGAPARLESGPAGVEKLRVAGDVDIERIAEDESIEPIAEPEPLLRSGQLTAGEWSDLRAWDFWTSVVHANDWKKMIGHWGFGEGTRISVRVDNGREPIVDAIVTLYDRAGTKLWVSRSDNHGRVELFTGLEKTGSPPPYDIVVEADDKRMRLGGVDPGREQSMNESPLVARLDADAVDPKVVDVMFAIDATGSMGDELRYIKAELGDVIERVAEEFDGEDVTIRLGANVYRDTKDEYLVRPHPMTEKVEDVVAFLYRQQAGGGGDTPEAVEVGLEDAIEKHDWSRNARARLLFLVLDAPPHHTEDRLEKIRSLVRRANELGIRVIPLSSSGVDKETEFLMRFLAIHTGGTYTFLTDHSGIGNPHIEPTIGSYEVEYLNDLFVRLIVQYTARPESLDAITPRTPELR